jgi:succinate-semialdehyde dehydrogenase/glutarate-semialdehyde dehydrogenase
MGKRIVEAREEADLSSQILDYYGRHGPARGAAAARERCRRRRAAHRPLGPLLTVQPWNYPLYQVARIAAPNLVLGNTILLKHASSCPQSALALEQVFRDAGVPVGVFTNLFSRPATSPP